MKLLLLLLCYVTRCFILSSLWEDPGFVLFEAALSNTPIISSNCRNGPVEIINNEKNGFLYSNNNLEDLVNKYDQFKSTDEGELKTKLISAKKYIKKGDIFQVVLSQRFEAKLTKKHQQLKQ